MKRFLVCTGLIFLLLSLIIIGSYSIVVANASGRTYEDVKEIPHNKVGLLLATSPITRGGAYNLYFENRIKSAEELYKAGKIDYIIASGGDYRKEHRFGCDEPQAIRDSLVTRGIPEDRIILDYDGTRTLNSIVKAKEIYGIDSVTLISQKYHNERAMYLADKKGLYTVGYNAEPSPIRRNRIKNTIREVFARPKMFLDLALSNTPDFEIGNEIISLKEIAAPFTPVDTLSTYNLNIYKPKYSNISLVCGERPDMENKAIIMMIGAAFTGNCLTEFDHSNICGSHTSNGEYYQNPIGERLTGTFTFSGGKPEFHYKANGDEILREAAQNGGSGFMQETIIHNSNIVPHTRPDKNVNQFRALCLLNDSVVVVESKNTIEFGTFAASLKKLGVKEALYTDMGPGWNYAWYRDSGGNPIEIHSFPTIFATNWITFYK